MGGNPTGSLCLKFVICMNTLGNRVYTHTYNGSVLHLSLWRSWCACCLLNVAFRQTWPRRADTGLLECVPKGDSAESLPVMFCWPSRDSMPWFANVLWFRWSQTHSLHTFLAQPIAASASARESVADLACPILIHKLQHRSTSAPAISSKQAS